MKGKKLTPQIIDFRNAVDGIKKFEAYLETQTDQAKRDTTLIAILTDIDTVVNSLHDRIQKALKLFDDEQEAEELSCAGLTSKAVDLATKNNNQTGQVDLFDFSIFTPMLNDDPYKASCSGRSVEGKTLKETILALLEVLEIEPDAVTDYPQSPGRDEILTILNLKEEKNK
jgi:hypothetical protein